jgi:hypothetical protein
MIGSGLAERKISRKLKEENFYIALSLMLTAVFFLYASVPHCISSYWLYRKVGQPGDTFFILVGSRIIVSTTFLRGSVFVLK